MNVKVIGVSSCEWRAAWVQSTPQRLLLGPCLGPRAEWWVKAQMRSSAGTSFAAHASCTGEECC